ncbi:hypothetical protein CU098_002744, partial [Rhizopus stolonifer]
YNDLKPPGKMEQDKKEYHKEVNPEISKATRITYGKYKKKDTDSFFLLVEDKKMSIRSAAAEIKIPKSTAYNWYKKGRESLDNDEDIVMDAAKCGAKMGSPVILNDTRKEYILSLIDEQPSLVLEGMMGGLISQFAGLKNSKLLFMS